MTIIVNARLNGVPVPVELDDDAITAIAAAVHPVAAAPPSPYMTIPEAADYLRCKRQRIDDLLSAGRLHRIKDGSRTLIAGTEIDAYLASGK